MDEDDSDNKNYHYVFMLFSLIMKTVLLPKDNVIFLFFLISKRITCLSHFELCFECKEDIFFNFNIRNINTNGWTIFLNFFPVIFSWLIWCYSSSVLKAFNIIFIDSIYCWFLFIIYIWSNMIRIYFMKFVMQSIDIIKDKITIFCWFSKPIWYLEKSDSKSSLIILSVSSSIMISVLSLSKCITHILSLSFEDLKLIAIVRWLFDASGFLRLLMIFFKYGLISSSYSLTGNVLFLSPLLSYAI